MFPEQRGYALQSIFQEKETPIIIATLNLICTSLHRTCAYLLYLSIISIEKNAYLRPRSLAPAVQHKTKPNWEALRLEIRDILEITKDNHSLGASPENVVTWCRIAKEESKRMVS